MASMQPAMAQGSAYISMQPRTTTSSAFAATPVRESAPSAYPVGTRELTATTASTGAPVIVTRLVSQNSFGSLPRYPQVVGATPGQAYAMPEAYAVSATSGNISEKATVYTSPPIGTMDVNDAMKATPVWSRTFGATSMQLQGEEVDRQLVVGKDARIMELTQQLQACNENAARLSDELEKARGEVARLTVELKQERFAREQAEAAAEAGGQNITPTASASGFTKRDVGAKPGGANARSVSASRRGREVREIMENKDDSAAAERPMTAAERREAQAAERRAAIAERRALAEEAAAARRAAAAEVAAERRAAAEAAQDMGAVGRSLSTKSRSKESPPGTSRPASAKGDEVDARLLDYVARSQCSLQFKRLNRGFYAFKRADEPGPIPADRTIEISIVNGKLMVKMEPSSHDPGWNNGKAGPIERFVLKMGEL
uniref:Uncharacterized protein n=1 Tax=Alexandrium andersonii TaxID=327968 RepID=A0A7S2AIG0_9DINO